MSGLIEYKKLGASGLSVSPIIVGCMSYGKKSWGEWIIEDEEKIFRILKKCYDNGIRTFDTADVYSNGHSEVILGKFLKKYEIPREKVVILTKLYGTIDISKPDFNMMSESEYPPFEYANSKGLSRKHIFDAIKGSVERLGTYVDVIQIHRLDNTVPKAEIMKALNDIVLAGHARYIGASSMRGVDFAELQYIADKNGWFKFISMQNYYNLLYREEEREMIPFCNYNELGKVGLIPWSPIARGILARPVGAQSSHNRTSTTDVYQTYFGLGTNSKAEIEIINRVEELSKKHNVSMAVIASAWVLSKGAFPIIGLNSEDRVDDALEALTMKFTDEEISYLEEPYEPKKIYGYI
ncbi:aryl-alcohol dehydrogenase [Scheffersomyces xylosifermentans]|uniref:aryl-alcohol dehydrogenase n=1 Tax=Scheffersomyces xylosifermentans TaxID=1304137 RepID=UPI00315D4A52